MPKSAEELFAAALELTNAADRAALLDRECAGNSSLRAEVESLLAALEQASEFLEKPPAAATLEVTTGTIPVNEKPGDKIGRYKLLQKIGEGGCGVVYMAEQEEPVRRRVALKIIKLGMDTRQVIARFEAERQALALMDHPNIAKVHDGGATETGRPYFVMELVRGIKITDYCDQNNLSTPERLGLFGQVCQAIQHAHQKGIIHRDIKPSNILVTTLHDGVPVPKVIDFGIAKATEGRLTDKTLFTEFQQFIGTPAYMSPEQAEMSGLDIDTRSDIYALGVLLYELLTGRTPFDAKELLDAGLDEMRRIIREKEPTRPSTRLTSLSNEELSAVSKHRQSEPAKLTSLVRGDLDWIVMKCLEKDRTRRYVTANGLVMDIQRHMSDEPVVARPPSAVYRFQKLVRRNKLAFAAAAAVACTLVLGVVVSTWQAVRATQAQREQVRLRQQAEAREKFVKAQALCDHFKFDEAEKLMSGIPAPALHAEARDAEMIFKALADYFARSGHWKEAAVDARKAVECDPTNHLNCVSLLSLLAANGDHESYHQYCREFLDRFGETKEEFVSERIAKACLILPSSGAELAIVDKLAEVAVTVGTNNDYLPYFQFAKGLADYRQGRFATAADWMRKSIDNPFFGDGHSRYVQAHMVLAMAQWQLKQQVEARTTLIKGIEIEQTKLPRLESGDLGTGWYWRDWIIAHALITEAKALIEGRSTVEKEKK